MTTNHTTLTSTDRTILTTGFYTFATLLLTLPIITHNAPHWLIYPSLITVALTIFYSLKETGATEEEARLYKPYALVAPVLSGGGVIVALIYLFTGMTLY